MVLDNSDVHMIYVLLDGVGDLPHPDLDGKTPLEAANTPTLDKIASNGVIGEVISVGKGIAPESDIAVFNMLGYKFQHADYVGRGVIESIGVGVDFKDGDLALRGNFSTLNKDEIIIDRRAGRHIEKEDANGVAKELEEKIKEFEKTLSPEQREAWEQFKELHQEMLGPTKLQDLKMDIPQLDPEILVTPKGDSDPADAILDLGKEIDGPHDYIRGLDEEQVKEIQRALGVDDDGKFGEKTLAAYIEYANNNELENGLTIEQLVQHFEENHSAPTVAFSDELDGLDDLWGADFGFEDFEPPPKFDFTNADLLAGHIGELPVNFSDQVNVNANNSFAGELNKPFTMLNEQDEVSLEGNVLNNTVDRTV